MVKMTSILASNAFRRSMHDVALLTKDEMEEIFRGPLGRSNNWRKMHGYRTRRGTTNKTVRCLFCTAMIIGMTQEMAETNKLP